MIELTTTALVVMGTSLIGFLSLVAVLVFLWKVYKRGGRQDLTAAAHALRDARPSRLLGAVDRQALPTRRKRKAAPAAPAVQDEPSSLDESPSAPT